jgi:osmotically-inducible protein OsmY
MLAPKHPRSTVMACIACLALAGCTQQDTDCLARIGRKLVERSQGAAGTIRNQMEGDFKGLPNVPVWSNDAGLKDRVEARLRWDALLADTRIEVQVTGAEVDLKGTVKNEAQRRRACDLTETTAGVQAVNDGLKVEE